jgi:hypothetical protein
VEFMQLKDDLEDIRRKEEIVLAIADMSRTAWNTMNTWSNRRSGENVSYQTHKETSFWSNPSPHVSLICYQDNLRQQQTNRTA